MGQPIEFTHSWDAVQWNWPLEHTDGIVKVHSDAKKFCVSLDVPFFTPDEVKVSVVGNEVLISCSHEERKDAHGNITRSIVRSYKLPYDVDKRSLTSTLSVRGQLHIEANKI